MLRFPTTSDLVKHGSKVEVFLHMFCDASHAPYIALIGEVAYRGRQFSLSGLGFVEFPSNSKQHH